MPTPHQKEGYIMYDTLKLYDNDVESYKPCFVLKGTMKEVSKTLQAMVDYELWRKFGNRVITTK